MHRASFPGALPRSHLRRFAFLGSYVAALSLGASQAQAQVFHPPVRFDLKPAATESLPGFVKVSELSVYGQGSDFGFTPGPLGAAIGDNPAHDVVEPTDDDRVLIRGCVRVASGTEFVCRLAPNTQVRARVLLASVPFYFAPNTSHYVAEPTAMTGIDVLASNGSALRKVAGGIELRTPYVKASLASVHGSYRKLWFTAKANAQGILRIRFTVASAAAIPVSSIELETFAPAPLSYRRVGSTWLQPAAGVSVPGLAAFHAGDYATARSQFLGIADPLVRATALFWLAGWLDGSDLGQADLLAHVESALADPTLATHPRARELRDQLDDARLAELHHSLLGYTESHALPPEGYGYFNPELPGSMFAVWPTSTVNTTRHLYLAARLYAQIGGDLLDELALHNAGSYSDPLFEAPPFTFRAIDRTARTYFAMNPLHVVYGASGADPDALTALERSETTWRGFQDLGFLDHEFQGNGELRLMAWMMRPENHEHGSNGGLFEHWNQADVPPSAFDPLEAWWTPLLPVAASTPPGAPPWAVAQRDYLQCFLAGVRWWLDRRAEDGEFGGGPGDDPELAALLSIPLAALRQPGDETLRHGLVEAADAVLDGEYVDDGYYSGPLTDVEHSAEFVSYPLLIALALQPGDPHYLQRCLDAARHFSQGGASGQPWGAAAPGGKFHFESYFFNDEGPADPQDPLYANTNFDVPLNGKALLPGFLFLAHASHAQISADFQGWAEGWRSAAFASAGGKPPGLLPAGVRWPDLDVGGSNWRHLAGQASEYSFPKNLTSLQHVYAGAFGLASSGPQGFEYLAPLVTLAKRMILLQAALDAGSSPGDLGQVGSANWALNELLSTPELLDLLALMRHTLLDDDQLRVVEDPWEPGPGPYVTDEFAAALDALLKAKSGSYASFLAQPQTGPDPLAGQYIRKAKSSLTASLELGSQWLRNFFPLATSHVAYTDRALLFYGSSHSTLYGTLTGGLFGSGLPSHVVTWETEAGATAPLDAAFMVNDLAFVEGTTQDRLRILLYNFEPASRTVVFRLWHRLDFGRYRMRVGAASSITDYFTGGTVDSTIDFDRLGRAYSFTLAPQTLTLLELERFADLPAAASFDLALSRAETSVDLTLGPAPALVVRSTMASAAPAPVPSLGVKLKGSLLGPGGQPLVIGPGGATEIDVGLDAPVPPLPAMSGFTLPEAALTRTLPLNSGLIQLLVAGYGFRFRFHSVAGSDLHALNDEAVVEWSLADL